MCRLLAVQSSKSFAITEHLEKFAEISRSSREFQGHGWGCAWLVNDEWRYYKNINPVWEDDLQQFGKSTLLMAHARSAFQDRDIVVENNMPFYDDRHIFIFNGELHGVKINAEGRIGAEKIFTFIKRFESRGMKSALKTAAGIIEKRSRYVRAMNIIISDKERFYLSTLFNEDEDYFTMHYQRKPGDLIICSDVYPGESGWKPIPNRTTEVFNYDDH